MYIRSIFFAYRNTECFKQCRYVWDHATLIYKGLYPTALTKRMQTSMLICLIGLSFNDTEVTSRQIGVKSHQPCWALNIKQLSRQQKDTTIISVNNIQHLQEPNKWIATGGICGIKGSQFVHFFQRTCWCIANLENLIKTLCRLYHQLSIYYCFIYCANLLLGLVEGRV